MTTAMLYLLAIFFIKHFIVDFLLQKPHQYLNKGTYGHPGGILHAGLHCFSTFAILLFFTGPVIALVAGTFDMLLHYHIDWAKVNINKKMGWGPTTHEEYWWMVGLDQTLHMLTYLGIIALI